MSGSLLDSTGESLLVIRLIHFTSAVMELDDTDMSLRYGSLAVKSGVKNPTMLPRFEDHCVLNEREVKETKALTLRTIRLQRRTRKGTWSMAAI